MRGEHREAARAGTQIQHFLHVIGIVDPVGEAVIEQFTDKRARNQYAFIDLEAQTHLLDKAQNVGCGNTIQHAMFERVKHLLALKSGERITAHLLETVER